VLLPMFACWCACMRGCVGAYVRGAQLAQRFDPISIVDKVY